MKTILNNNKTKLLVIKSFMLAALFFISFNGKSQCTPAFTYTVGASGTVTFSNTSMGGNQQTFYSLNCPGANPAGGFFPLSTPFTVTYTANGTFTATVLMSGPSCTIAASDTIVITNSVPQSSCSAYTAISLVKDTTANFTWDAFPNYPNNVTSVIWNWNDGTGTTTGLYPSHTFSAAGVYTVCAQVIVACGDTAINCISANIYKSSGNSSAMIQLNVKPSNSVTGIKNTSTKIVSVSLYPNPTTGEFNLQLKDVNAKSVELIVFNILGKVVYNTSFNTENSGVNKTINLSEVPNGTYFVKVKTGNSVSTQKLIINK